MRGLITLIFLSVAVLPAQSAEANTLSADEIRDGWLILFDGETPFGWKTEGEVKAENGELRLGGARESAVHTTAVFGNFVLRFEFRYEGTDTFYVYMFGHKPGMKSTPSQWHRIEYRVDTDEQSTRVSKTPLPDGIANTDVLLRRPTTDIGFSIPAGGTLAIRNIRLKPTNLETLFNGKDLSGWKVFPGVRYKSKFTVTPEGWINVKNGPGDLQTDKTFADFVFQGECISNGDHLNSGIFFRCLPNQYQQGYEMQIRNEWKDNDRTKPVDFGTGAIYRRQPARKVVSSDREWFTMTLVAHGNHFATWVNGYQVTDWTDTRPENENARNGLRLGAGHLSIQGHDPTTDLSFRNLRAAELKK
jgi:hypothetical protein